MDFFAFAIAVLFVLALIDLSVGVSNDAVNFLNSAIGSRVATRRTILIVASFGVIVGAVFYSGIMEVARKGIFNPEMFTFADVMIVFLAVMIADVLLLDLPPGTGDVAISAAQLLPNAEVVVVTSPQEAAAEVAVRAAFKAVQDGVQVAVLCPTTLLAEQHGETFSERLRDFPVNVDVLSRFLSRNHRRNNRTGAGGNIPAGKDADHRCHAGVLIRPKSPVFINF